MKFILKIFIALFILSFTAQGATLGEYTENIKHLKEDLNKLIAPEDDWTDEDESEICQRSF